MNADEARTLMLETEARILMLLQHFEQESGLTIERIDLDHYTSISDRRRRHVQKVLLEVVLR